MTDMEVTYCEMQVNNHWSTPTYSDVMLAKTIQRLLLSHFIHSPQAPPAQNFLQISQNSPSHSAAQMRFSGTFLGARIPFVPSLV